MSQKVEDIIEHYGKKGMKWGVRNETSNLQSSIRGHQPPKMTRKDKKWQKNIYSIHGAVAVHNNVADKMNNGEIDKFNAKHAKPGHNYLDNSSPETHRYMAEYEKLNAKLTEQAVKEVHGTSPSGGYKATFDKSDPAQWKIVVKPVSQVRHASEPFPTLTMELITDQGKVVGIKYVKDDVMAQSMSVEDVIEHYGKKGMKWGVRSSKSKKKSTDRTRFDKAPKRLTAKELEARINRMQMEKKYNELNKRDVNLGSRMAGEVLKGSGKKVATTVLVGAALYGLKVAISKKSPEAASMITKRGK